MSNLYFAIHILSSLLALSCSYALIMSLLKKEVNTVWARYEAVIGLVTSGIALSLVYGWFLGTWSLLLILSAVALIGGFSLLLAIVIIHRVQLAHSKEYSALLVPITKKLAYGAFGLLLVHIFLEVASVSGM